MSRLAVVALNENEFFIFFIADSGAIYANHWKPNQAITWKSEYGNPYPITSGGIAALNGSITAVARTNSEIQVFFTGLDGALWTTYCYIQNNKTVWREDAFRITDTNIIALNSLLAAAVINNGQTYVFFIGTNGKLWVNHRSFAYPAWQNDNHCLIQGDSIVENSLSVVTRKKDEINVFFTDKKGVLWTLCKNINQKILEAKIFPLTDINLKNKINTRLLAYTTLNNRENLSVIFIDNTNTIWCTSRTTADNTAYPLKLNSSFINNASNLFGYYFIKQTAYLIYSDTNSNIKILHKNINDSEYNISSDIEKEDINHITDNCITTNLFNINFFWMRKNNNIWMKNIIQYGEKNNIISTSNFDYVLNLHPLGFLQEKLTKAWTKMFKQQSDNQFLNKALYYPPHITLSSYISGKNINNQDSLIAQLRNALLTINAKNLSVTDIKLEKYESDDCPYFKVEAKNLHNCLYNTLKDILPLFSPEHINNHPLHITLVYPEQNINDPDGVLINKHKKVIQDEFNQTDWKTLLTNTSWKVSLWRYNINIQEEISVFELADDKLKESHARTYYYPLHTKFNFLKITDGSIMEHAETSEYGQPYNKYRL